MVVVGKLVIDGSVYDAVTDENDNVVQLSRYDETHQTSVILSFDNTSDGSASAEVLRRLKQRYLENL